MSWRSTEPIVLIDESDTVRPMSANPSRRLIQPTGHYDWSWCEEVMFILSVAAVVGAPSAFSMTPRLMFAQAHTVNNMYRQPRWFYADTTLITQKVAEGTFFPAITAVGTYVRTVRRPPREMAIDLGESGGSAISFTGGTNPGLTMSLVAYPKVAY